MIFSRRTTRILLAVLFLLVLMATLADFSAISLERVWDPDSFSLRDGWTLSIDGEEIDTDFTLPTVLRNRDTEGKVVTLSRLIPEEVPHMNSLLVRLSQRTARIAVDGKTVYTYDGNLEGRRIKIPGYINHFAWLPDDAAGKMLTISSISHSSRTSGVFHEVFLGSRVSQLGALFRYDGFSLVVGILILMTAFVVAFLALMLFRRLEVFQSALAFAGIEFCAALWIIGGSMSTQLFLHNQLILLVAGVVAMFLLPVFLTWFVSSMYHLPQSRVLGRLVLIFPLAFIIVSVMQLLRMTTYYSILTPGAIALFVYLLVLISCSFKALWGGNRAIKDFLVAIGCLFASVLGELILLFLPFMTLLNALVLNLGIIAFGTVLLRQMVLLVMQFVEKKGRDEYLETLVHMDGLTGLANRRAFDERMETLRSAEELDHSVGLVIFDVNDLKKLNDEQGHSAGDALLKEVADGLAMQFKGIGQVYRIGGDEFAMICEPCTHDFFDSFSAYVGSELETSSGCRIGVAFGAAKLSPKTDSMTIDELFKLADARMYQHKLGMKNGSVR
ncbi:MAG: GGDEF domain-containing protein [Sphaerochaetaceae bacterium]|nr:GGDEF domain-containing protein [Sphaerochaetaceae bacterium]